MLDVVCVFQELSTLRGIEAYNCEFDVRKKSNYVSNLLVNTNGSSGITNKPLRNNTTTAAVKNTNGGTALLLLRNLGYLGLHLALKTTKNANSFACDCLVEFTG